MLCSMRSDFSVVLKLEWSRSCSFEALGVYRFICFWSFQWRQGAFRRLDSCCSWFKRCCAKFFWDRRRASWICPVRDSLQWVVPILFPTNGRSGQSTTNQCIRYWMISVVPPFLLRKDKEPTWLVPVVNRRTDSYKAQRSKARLSHWGSVRAI